MLPLTLFLFFKHNLISPMSQKGNQNDNWKKQLNLVPSVIRGQSLFSFVLRRQSKTSQRNKKNPESVFICLNYNRGKLTLYNFSL